MRVLIDGQTLGTPEMRRGIGKVFREILDHMVDGDVRHDWSMVVSDPAHMDLIGPRVRRWIEPVYFSAIAAIGDPVDMSRAYGRQLTTIAEGIGAEVYWDPNPLMPNVYFPLEFSHCPAVMTLHDVIPLVMPERYRPVMGETLWSDYTTRCKAMIDKTTRLVAVSNASRDDFRKCFPEFESTIDVVHHASDGTRFWPYVQGDALSDPPYILFVGGFDPRKNMDNALRAFAAFARQPGRQQIRFKVVCGYAASERDRFVALACELGVEERLDLPGYVDDDELGRLFRGAGIFFFPSLYEGFGLPVLDALACGLPVVASGNSSIPEVAGEHATYCDPHDVVDMVHCLEAAWSRERDPRSARRIAAVAHARTFRWNSAAARYLRIFEEEVEQNRPGTLPRPDTKPRVACLSPWPPQMSGVADYSCALMPELLARMDVTLFVEEPETAVALDGLTIRSMSQYAEVAASFDGVLYHLGNGLTHVAIYEHAWAIPGIVILHDFNIHPFFHSAFVGNPRETLYLDALTFYGPEGIAAWESYRDTGTPPGAWLFPMTQPVVARSRAAIVHSRWVAGRFAEGPPILRVHLGAKVPEAISPSLQEPEVEGFHLDPHYLWIGVFGFINMHKRLHSVFASVSRLHAKGYPVRVLVVGEVNDSSVNLVEMAAERGIAELVIHETYVPEAAFDARLSAVDVVLNLRYPTMGESSASLFRALSREKACVVSDYAAFSETPDSVSWKVDPFEPEIDVLTAFIEALLRDPLVRERLGKNALAFVTEKASFAQVADTYLRAVRLAASSKATGNVPSDADT
jgi:glycosyltransferase involved in cell wall biosynthesis